MDALNFTKQIPSWLDQNLFDTAIRSFTSDQHSKVTNFNIKSATKPGENFASAVFRAEISFVCKNEKNERQLTVIIKTLPVCVDLPNMEHMADTSLFEVEIAAYADVLGKIQDLVAAAGYDDVMCPRLIYQTLTPKPVIILEDVKTKGFDFMSKYMYKDYEVSKMVFQRLAKFHAASFYLYENQEIDAASFNICMFTIESIGKFYDEFFEILLESMTEWGGFDKFLEPVGNFRKNYIKEIGKIHSPSTHARSINVLNHGDFHPKNVLYKMKTDGTAVDDFVMFDFQFFTFASPAVDLIYAFYTFVSDENRLKKFDELLEIYHKQFIEALNKFGYSKQPPTLKDLQNEMEMNGLMEVTIFLLTFPELFVELDGMTNEDFDDGLKKMIAKCYKNERFLGLLKDYLMRFVRKGFLKI